MIHQLGPSSYRGGLPGEFLQGVHSVHLARIRFPDGVFPAFVKLFPPGSGGLANETLGWLLARLCKVNVAARAALVEITTEQLVGRIPSFVRKEQSVLTGWAVQQIDGKPLALLHGGDGSQDDHWEEVIDAPMGAKICALDEWLVNGDRHPGNLIRDSRSVWWAIDFSEMLGSSLWPAMIDFGVLDSATNQILMHARERLAKRHLGKFLGSLVNQAEHHQSAWAALDSFALQLLTKLHGADAAAEVVSFLRARSHPNWMPDRLHLI